MSTQIFRSTGIGYHIHRDAQIGNPPQHRDYDPRRDTHHGVTIGSEVKIGACAVIDAGWKQTTRIGDRTWIMALVHVAHDCRIGDDCELATGTVLAGHTTVGDRVRIGVNACTRPGVTIGDDARIGAGAVVIRDIPAGQVWAGNPARRIP